MTHYTGASPIQDKEIKAIASGSRALHDLCTVQQHTSMQIARKNEKKRNIVLDIYCVT